jgi:hypothetical protein
VRFKSHNVLLLAGAAMLAVTTAACGDFIRQDRASVTLVIDRLDGASGSTGSAGTFGGTVDSDVLTKGGTFNDFGRVTMRSIMKDVGTAPTPVNAVTITRYTVKFRRADGRNTPGVDVPYPFDSAITFTVAPGPAAIQTFELVRHTAKEDAPLRALSQGNNFAVTIATVADVTFFGHDQAGNELSVVGSIGVIFGDFADPQ